MAMSNKTLRPRVSLHPEALAWSKAVTTNSGTVSGATVNAISRFCKSIDAAGLRSRMFRVNLFCGTQLAAALVPLYRSVSFGGTAYGNATDTAVNVIAADYSQAVGITGNAVNKYLNLGSMALLMPSWANHHIGVDTTGETSANFRWMGVFWNGTPTGVYADYGAASLYPRTGPLINADSGRVGNQAPNPSTDSKLKLLSRSSSTSMFSYNNAVSSAVLATEAGTLTTVPAGFSVMAMSYQNVSAGVPAGVINGYEPSAASFRGYTIGLSLTAAQVTAYNTIWATFRTAMGRP